MDLNLIQRGRARLEHRADKRDGVAKVLDDGGAVDVRFAAEELVAADGPTIVNLRRGGGDTVSLKSIESV